MKIILEDKVALALETAVAQTRGLEFSGFGWVKVAEDALRVYDYIILHVGSHGFTSIPSRTMLELMDRDDAAGMKLWVHRHPVGNGVPGPHNWSGTDHDTCVNTPLGGIPELVKWSAAIVRTPRGWVGRLDNHIRKTTLHVPVLPDVGDVFVTIDKLYRGKLVQDDARLAALHRELEPSKPVFWPWKAKQMALPVTLAEAYGFEDLDDLTRADIDLLEGLDEDDCFADWADEADDYGGYLPRSQRLRPRRSIHSKVQSFLRRLR